MARLVGRTGIIVLSAAGLSAQPQSAEPGITSPKVRPAPRADIAADASSACPTDQRGAAFAGAFALPVDPAAEMMSPFGMRRHPILRRTRMHTGVDWESPMNEAVYAPADGVVAAAGRAPGYGNRIVLDHGNGWRTTYSFLDAIHPSPCEVVRVGQEIGRIGSTGATTGRHLHFEVLRDGEFVDPQEHLPKPKN
jgi:murein DD-endopeptidase MepM/ murein hydrolase activator NlpD